MPYHLLDRPQQAKNILFRYSDMASRDTRNRVRRSATKIPYVAELPVSSHDLIQRAARPHPFASTKSAPPTSPWLTVMLAILSVMVFASALYLGYTRHRSAIFSRRISRKDKEIMSPAEFAAFYDRRHHSALGWRAPSGSFGLNKRRKPPPPSLDLEALKPQKGTKRGFWDSLPSIVPGRGNAFTPSYSKKEDEGNSKSAGGSGNGSGSGSAWSSSSAYSAGAGAKLIAEMVPERLSSAMKGSMWGSQESLVSRIVGDEEEGGVLPVIEDTEDDMSLLGKYFEAGGVGIKAEV
ncbi:MAG: hypothetical protein Q9216_005077 [Gyalolechia sp. 2 TL-2023]